jgi:hypothetical protein
MHRLAVLAACMLVAACAGTVKEGMAADSRSLVPRMFASLTMPTAGRSTAGI